MRKKLMFIEIRGRTKKWFFQFYGNPEFLEEWQCDDLKIYEIENQVPAWVVDIGLCRPYMFFQDVYNFKNPFKKKSTPNDADI